MHALERGAHDSLELRVPMRYRIDLYQIGKPEPMVVQTREVITAELVYRMANELPWIEGCYVRKLEDRSIMRSFDRQPRRLANLLPKSAS